MGDIGSAISGAGSAIGSGLSDATSGLGGFGSALSGFGSMMNAFGGGQSAGQAYGQGGVDPNTGQPIDQPPPQTPQTAQAQSQGPLAGATPPGTDPATVVGGTQSRPQPSQGGYASVLQRLAQNVLPTMPTPTQATEPGVSPSEAGLMDPAVSANPDSTSYDPNQGALPAHVPQWGPKHAGGSPSGPIIPDQPARPVTPTPASAYGNYGSQGVPPIGGGPGNVQEAPTGRESDPVADTGDLGKQYGDFLAGQGVGRPVAGANLPAAGAQPVSATGGGTGAGGVPGAAQGQGDGMQNLVGGLMQMFLPMILGSLMGGGGGGMGAMLPMMMMGGMMGPGGLGNMFGGRRMVPGFGGGMLRPGYYPDGRGGFGFHPGGFHGGWRPHYIGAYGGGRPGWGTGSPAGSYGAAGSPAAVRQRGIQGMSYLTSKGLPPASAAAILGNAAGESGIRPLGLGGDQGTSGGMFQWHGPRWGQFQQWAQRNGRDPSEPTANYDFMLADMQQNYPQLWARLQQGGDPAQLSDLVERVYEAPKDWTASAPYRRGVASDLANAPASGATASAPAAPQYSGSLNQLGSAPTQQFPSWASTS